MMNFPNIRILPTAVAALTLLTAAGCASQQYDADFDAYDLQQSRTKAILDAQYDAGAREDATLHDIHFTADNRLNGLGQEKLDRMVAGAVTRAGGERAKLTVFVSSDPTGEQGEAIWHYLDTLAVDFEILDGHGLLLADAEQGLRGIREMRSESQRGVEEFRPSTEGADEKRSATAGGTMLFGQ